VFKPVHDLLARAGITATEVRLVGQVPADAIVEQAKKSKLDLLAMGSIGFGASRHTPMGSVATRVASRCRTALLLVREK
jgi:nucleotide-binding universal stress UspA family protein